MGAEEQRTMKLSKSMPPGTPWTSRQQVELVGEMCVDLLHVQPMFSQILGWHKDAKTINSSYRRFWPIGEKRTNGAMNTSTAVLLYFEKGTVFCLSGGCRFMRAGGGGCHTNKRLIPDHPGEPALLCTLDSSWHSLAVGEVNNCVEEGPGYRHNFRQAVLPPLLPSRVGCRQAPCLRFFQAHQFHGQGGRGEGQAFHHRCALWKARTCIPAWGEERQERELHAVIWLEYLLQRGERSGTCRERGSLSDKSSSSPATSSECIPSRGYACPPKAVLHGLAASAGDALVWKKHHWKTPGFTHIPLSPSSLDSGGLQSPIQTWWLILSLTSTSFSLSSSRTGGCSEKQHYFHLPNAFQGYGKQYDQ